MTAFCPWLPIFDKSLDASATGHSDFYHRVQTIFARRANHLRSLSAIRLLRPHPFGGCEKFAGATAEFHQPVQRDGFVKSEAKRFCFRFSEECATSRKSRLDQEGRSANRHQTLGRDAMDAERRQTGDVKRTAKSCGPGTPGLVLSLRDCNVGPSGPTRWFRRRR